LGVTAAVPMLELTVGVRDGGSPPRSTVGSLLLVVDPLAAVADVEAVTVSHSLGLTLFIVVGSAIAAVLLAVVVVFIIVVR